VAKRDATAAGKLSAQLWAALGYLAGKRKNRDLIDTKPTRVDVIIEGKIGRSKICEHVVGVLSLGQATQRASTEAADTNHLVALLLRVCPDEAAAKKSIAEYHAKHKRLPDATEAEIEAAKQFLALLRSHVVKPVAGAITFEVSAETTA
jgi:hypothetical protein